MNYYNEFDPKAAAWLRELIKAGLIPAGEVDERSICDVKPTELHGYTQCHFFAGIGGWSRALQLAGWPEDRPVWTGSCPCQPFSAAGKGLGVADERHLWPVFAGLIRSCRPPVVFGEQVASAAVVGHKGKRPRVSNQVSKEEPSTGLDATRPIPSIQEESPLQLGPVHPGNPSPNQCGVLRSIGTPVQSGQREDVGQSVNRPSELETGLHLRQHPSGLPCCEQCFGRLGRGEAVGNCSCNNEEMLRRLERIFAETRGTLESATSPVWLDGIRLDLERAGYAVGACDLPAAGVGAPHIRQRLWWVAHADSGRDGRDDTRTNLRAIPETDGQHPDRMEHTPGDGRVERGAEPSRGSTAGGCGSGGRVAHAKCSERGAIGERREVSGGREQTTNQLRGSGSGGGMGHPDDEGSQGRDCEELRECANEQAAGPGGASFWGSAIWHPCRDGKARRVEPAIFPLAHGIPGRVGLLRGAGNAIVPQVAAEFIGAFMEVEQ